MNSVSTDVTFVSATDLRLAGASLGDAALAGESDTYIFFDIDDNPRSMLAPYMGAYEGPFLPVIATGFELMSPETGANVQLVENAEEPIVITWEPSYSTEAWGTMGFEFVNDAFAHAGNGLSGDGKYVGSMLDMPATLTSPVLQNAGDLSFYIATYNNQTALTVVVEQTVDGETWIQIESFDAVSGGTGEINFDWQKKTVSLNADITMVRFRVTGDAIAGAVYFDDFTMTSFDNTEEVTDVESFESWSAFKTLSYTWHLDTPSGDFSAPVLSLLSDDDGQTPSLTLTHAELDAALASLNVPVGEAYSGRWNVTAQVGTFIVFGEDPNSISIRRIVPVVSIDDREAPLTFALEQNFPNPFNPTTSIRFSVPETANVTLNVYSITGQLVATLVNEVRPAGVYNVSFDASSLASGVYIYRIHAGGFTSTQKMTLIK